MHAPVPSARHLTLLLFLCIAVPVWAPAQQHSEAEIRFNAARAQTDPAERISALQSFLAAFPADAHTGSARELLLATLLSSAPDRTAAIHQLALTEINNAPTGFDRWVEESRLADLFASAPPDGADLPDAHLWAQDAVQSLSEESFRHEMAAAQVRYKLPRIPQRQLHAQFVGYRASFLAALAHVLLCEHAPERAASLLTEAFRLQPLSGEVNALRGQLALEEGRDAEALQSLERADAVGALLAPWRAQELVLFQKLHGGSDALGLDQAIDRVYRTLFPPVFTLPHRQLAAGGHPALLELFTGSGCSPCAGPDLAIDSLLASYGRQDLIVLAYDVHIPRPDPLANPDAILRAASYGVANTPTAFLDGQPMEVLGASREDVENLVVEFAEQVEEQASLPSGLHLALAVETSSAGTLSVHPSLTVVPLPATPTDETTGDVSLHKLSRAVLNVALVQDNLRYSGENGIRFHRMVVRALSQGPAPGFLGSAPPLPVRFDLAALEATQQSYLQGFERNNDRFGAFHFRRTDFPLRGGDLAIVAWVQDPVTHRVLQSSYLPVPQP